MSQALKSSGQNWSLSDPGLLKSQAYINGEWVESNSTTFGDVWNPATGEKIAKVAYGTKEDVDAAVKAAIEAYWEWRTTPPLSRARYLFRLKEAFERRADIHRETAARVLHKEPADVTAGERSMAKMVNFGLAYGMSDYGLATRASIPREEAREFIDSYFGAYTGISRYMVHDHRKIFVIDDRIAYVGGHNLERRAREYGAAGRAPALLELCDISPPPAYAADQQHGDAVHETANDRIRNVLGKRANAGSAEQDLKQPAEITLGPDSQSVAVSGFQMQGDLGVIELDGHRTATGMGLDAVDFWMPLEATRVAASPEGKPSSAGRIATW